GVAPTRQPCARFARGRHRHSAGRSRCAAGVRLVRRDHRHGFGPRHCRRRSRPDLPRSRRARSLSRYLRCRRGGGIMGLTIAIGIATGCVYALVAVGYSLIYRTTGVVNFAQGSYVMVGGFATWWFFTAAALPYPLAIAAGVGVTTLVGLGLWVGVVLPLWRRRSAPYVVLLSTIVFGAVVGNAALLLLGSLPQTLPSWLPGWQFDLRGSRIDGQYGLIVAATLLLMAGFAALLRLSPLGR